MDETLDGNGQNNETGPTQGAASLPPHYQKLLEEIDSHLKSGDLLKAGLLSEQALALGLEHPQLLSLAAYQKMQSGEIGPAIAYLQRAYRLAPQDLNILNALGIAFRRGALHKEAHAAFDAATMIDPSYAAGHYNKGTVLEDLGDPQGAREAYEAAVAAEPGFADALVRLSYLAAQRGDFEVAASYRARLIEVQGAGDGEAAVVVSAGDLSVPNGEDAARRFRDEQLTVALARAEIEARDFKMAQTRLEQLLDRCSEPTKYLVYALLGDCHQALGQFPAAFEYYVKAKSEQQRTYAERFAKPGAETFRGRTDRIEQFFSKLDAPWRGMSERASSGVASHVFLVGFPRSGTTLLEVILSGHPDIATIEERDTLDEGVKDFIQPADGLERLARADEKELDRYREAYWRACETAVPGYRGKVLVDKLPLNTVQLGLVAKLFPQAKILFAIRDPRDVVWSCLRHLFDMNIAMYEFCTLEGSAELYNSVMRLAEVYRKKLDLPFYDHSYETMVGDFEGSVRALCGFLGVPWDKALADFQARARARAIKTPSAVQVARGLYDGSGQWQPYVAQLAPVLPVLDRWVERFGYSPR